MKVQSPLLLALLVLPVAQAADAPVTPPPIPHFIEETDAAVDGEETAEAPDHEVKARRIEQRDDQGDQGFLFGC